MPAEISYTCVPAWLKRGAANACSANAFCSSSLDFCVDLVNKGTLQIHYIAVPYM